MQPRMQFLTIAFLLGLTAQGVENAPAVPRIDSIELDVPQPWKKNPDVIWYDDFDGDEATQQAYHEYGSHHAENVRVEAERLGATGKSLRIHYPKGSQGIGGRKLTFGDCPFGPPLRKGEKFEELYWRIYVKHPANWTGGGPDKMSRCTSFSSGKWTQAMIGHVWSSGEALTLDPASGIKDGRVVTTKYNDFPNLKWLGNKPVSPFLLHSSDQAGRWVCVEAHVKLNTPGQKDGIMRLWVDGLLQCDRKALDWRGTYTEHGINAVFLEAYWNKGSPVEQSRWYDDFVVSTKPIGPLVASKHPVLRRTPYAGPEGSKPGAWEAQVAEKVEAAAEGAEQIFKRLPDEWGHQKGEDVWLRTVWSSKPMGAGLAAVSVSAENGSFSGALAKEAQLQAGGIYWVRCRQQDSRGLWSGWSDWHQPMRIASP